METKENLYRPFTRKWDGFDHYHFICWSYAYYRAAKRGYETQSRQQDPLQFPYRYWRSISRWEMWDTVLRLFKAGKRNYVLDLSFEDFWQRLDPVDRPYSNPPYHSRVYRQKKDYSDFYPMNGAHFRQKVPLRIAEKKVLSEEEISRREWREKKGFNCRRSKYRRGPTHFWKKNAARERRGWEKKFVFQENWDDYITETRRDFIDKRRWD